MDKCSITKKYSKMHAISQVNIRAIISKFVEKIPGMCYAKQHLTAEHLVSLYLKESFTECLIVKFSRLKDSVIATLIKANDSTSENDEYDLFVG